MARILVALLTAGLLGGCIVLPLDYYDHRSGHRHREWSDRAPGDHAPPHRHHREWRYRDRY